MICVQGVDIVQVPRDTFELEIKKGTKCILKAPFVKEVIRGRVFINSRGEEVCLAMTREVQITIGLPFEAFENQGKQIEDLSAEVGRKRAQLVLSGLSLSMYEGAGFFQRLKYLFTRRIEWRQSKNSETNSSNVKVGSCK